jgi:hypothetical protein
MRRVLEEGVFSPSRLSLGSGLWPEAKQSCRDRAPSAGCANGEFQDLGMPHGTDGDSEGDGNREREKHFALEEFELARPAFGALEKKVLSLIRESDLLSGLQPAGRIWF